MGRTGGGDLIATRHPGMLIGLDGGMRSTESTEPKASLGEPKITHPALLQGRKCRRGQIAMLDEGCGKSRDSMTGWTPRDSPADSSQ